MAVQSQESESGGSEVPVIDVAALIHWSGGTVPGAVSDVAHEIDAACREVGFFSIVGHGIEAAAFECLERLAREFFALPEAEKARIGMAEGGRAWRGWFPVGAELTSGEPDGKEGLYFGEELPSDDPRVTAGWPLHGPNLFPERPTELRTRVLEMIQSLTTLGHQIIAAIALGLGLDPEYFAQHLTADPVVLMRIFHYPPATQDHGWGVGEHTDYGLLTLLHQDASGGLEVRTSDGWTQVEPTTNSLVCNIGDMLDRMTGGRYRATAHRVRPPRSDRISIPFFFDPGWDAEVAELPLGDARPSRAMRARWDGRDLAELSGTYGDYLTSKVAKVFPALNDDVNLESSSPDTN